MSTLGKGVTSVRKQDLQTQKSLGTGVKKMVFYHQATLSDTGINLNSLSMPSSLASIGKTNPSAAAIAAGRLYFFQDNFQLFSSLRGWLMPSSFVIASSTQINFVGFTAADGEIFIGYLDNIIQPSLHAADVNPINATGTLAVGNTDFAVSPFTTDLYPLTQLGAVLVFRNGVLQMRNTNNATAAPGADGNYQEVPSTGGTSSIIRFNVAAPGPTADNIVVCANGALIEQPTDSQMAYIEVLAGQINSMITVLADTAGVPTSTFGSNPSSVDLRVFGDQVIALSTTPTQTIYTSGSGTYTPPTKAKWIKVKMIGGGGGGSGSGNTSTAGAGGAGGDTTLGALTAHGGTGAAAFNGSNAAAGTGGSYTLGVGVGFGINGGSGGGNTFNVSGSQISGGMGAASFFGGAGGTNGATTGASAVTNSGSGGGGGGVSTTNSTGSGGGAGAYVEVVISNPSSMSYSVGSGGAFGTAGTSGFAGGAGGSGIIIIEEHYGG